MLYPGLQNEYKFARPKIYENKIQSNQIFGPRSDLVQGLNIVRKHDLCLSKCHIFKNILLI